VAGPPPMVWGGHRATRYGLGVAAQPFQLSFFFLNFFFLKKISIFIYFLINLYFFITMDTCRWRDIWLNLLKILTKFDASDRFVIIAYHEDLPWTF
jgi:hypothetical protein